MANQFQSCLMVPAASVTNTMTPQLADFSFWSNCMASRADYPPGPSVSYSIATSGGDEVVDEFDNQFITA